MISAWDSLFPDADVFARSCAAASLAETGDKERRRRTEEATGAPMCPWNLRLFRQTFHGGRLLTRLVVRDRVAVLPWSKPDAGDVRVVEICPAATLREGEEISRGYKGAAVRHSSRRKTLLAHTRRKWHTDISSELARVVVADRGGDALDAVLAAVSTYHHAARLTAGQHAVVRSKADLMEGNIYAAGTATTLDPDSTYARWLKEFEALFNQVTDLVHKDDVFWQINAVGNESTVLNAHGGVVRDWIIHAYVWSSLVRIRALLDGTAKTLSLYHLLGELAAHAQHVLTRDRYVGMYPNRLREAGHRDFDRLAGVGKSTMPKKIVLRDRDMVKAAARTITNYTNQRITHLRKNPDDVPVSYNDIRRVIRDIDVLMRKYVLLLRAAGMQTLVPTIQSAWHQVFYEPWLEPSTPLPRYVPLDRFEDDE